MRIIGGMILVILVIIPMASAQERPVDDAAHQAHKGQVKIWLGSAMVVAGAVAVPVTATHDSQQPSDVALVTGIGLVGAGSALIWSGVQNQRRALRPQTTVRFAFGRVNSLQIHRSW